MRPGYSCHSQSIGTAADENLEAWPFALESDDPAQTGGPGEQAARLQQLELKWTLANNLSASV